MNNTEYTLNELLVVNLYKDFKNGEVGFTGLATGKYPSLYITSIPLVAMELARKTHAPDLTILLAGWIQNPDLSKFNKVPDAELAEYLRDIPCESQMTSYPGQYPLRRGSISFGFGTGVQIDKIGNINSVCIGKHDAPKVRLVGPILLPEHFSMFGREYIMMPYHEKRTFVNHVDYIAGVGYPGGLEGRKKLGLESGGPELVFTPKAIFDFDKKLGTIKIRSMHPGTTKKEILESTDFELPNLDNNLQQSDIPTKEELKLIREEIDPKGIFLNS